MNVAASTHGAKIRRFPNFRPFPLQRDFSDGSSTPGKDLSCPDVSARRRSDLIEPRRVARLGTFHPLSGGTTFKQNGEPNEADLYDCGAGVVGAASHGFGGVCGKPALQEERRARLHYFGLG